MSAPRQCGRCGMVTCCECGWPLLLACAIADRHALMEALRLAIENLKRASEVIGPITGRLLIDEGSPFSADLAKIEAALAEAEAR